MVHFLSTVSMLDENASAEAKHKIDLVKNYLDWEEVEDAADSMKDEKAFDIISGMTKNKKWYFYAMAFWVANANDNISKQEEDFIDNLAIACEIGALPEGKMESILDDMIETVSKPRPTKVKNATYFQKQFQEDLDSENLNFSWDRIIPESGNEMVGALMFCKQHVDSKWQENNARKTLSRLVEVCDMDYADDPDVQKILPSLKALIKEYEDNKKKEAEKKAHKDSIHGKVKMVLWLLILVFIVFQIVSWGWWAILSGVVTVIVGAIIHFILFDMIFD